ncbi:MAG: carboxypeptidase regulatory-like domain-containing protein [Deltaproteobacteria bacterium]|nr:carboxypeptidase regulatory-like domain-containing protein [Deltaproteobacteria bacterium]
MKRLALALALIPVLLVGCPADVTTWSNPYDPESIAPAPGLIQGVVAETSWDSSGNLVAQPIAGATVTVSKSPEAVTPATTDAAGAFSFDGLPPGEYQLLVTAVGYQPASLPVIDLPVATQRDLGSIYLVPLSTTDDASTLSGVTTLEGAPSHEGILIRMVGRPFQTLTAPDGSWSMRLSEGTYDLEMSAADYQPVLLSGTVVPRAADLQLDPVVLLANPGSIEGIVERQTCEADPRNEVILPAEGALAAALPSGGTTVADPTGAFVLGGLSAGSYAVRVSLDGHESVTVNGLTVRGGRSTTLPEPLLLPAAKGGVTGRVTLTGETNHAGALVQIEGTPFVAFTGSDGSFFLEGVCAGTNYQLMARRDGFIEQSVGGVTVTAGGVVDVGELQLARQQGGLVLHSGNAFANLRTVAYQLEAPTGTTEMRIGEDETLFDDPARADEGWVPYATNGTYDLAGPEGEVKVFAQVRGSSGVGAKVSDVVILDLTAPTDPRVVVEDDSGWSRDPDGVLLLTLTASDAPPLGSTIVTSGLAAYKVLTTDVQACAPAACSEPAQSAWDLATLQPYNRSLDFPMLRPSVDEEKEVWVRFQDRAGNWSASANTKVVLDREAPDGTVVEVEGGSTWSRTAIVSVGLTAADENQAAGLTMRLASDSGFSGAVWQPYQSVITWFLSPGDGAKQVFAQFRDPAGNVSAPVSDGITLDTVGPTGARLAIDQAPYAGSRNLTLTTGAQGASEMVVSLAPDFTDLAGNPVAWESYDVSTTLQLPDADGPYVLYGKYRDAAGNETVRLDAAVTLDRDAPVIASASIVEGAAVSTPNVTLLVQAVAGAAYAHEMKVDVEDVASGGLVQGIWGPFNPTQPVTLAAPRGVKRVHVTLRDAAGNTSAPRSVDVEWDDTAPQITLVTLAGGAPWVTETALTLDVVATGATELQVSNRADFAGALWQPYATPLAWTLDPGDGAKTVHVRVRDSAGNLDTSSASVSLDRTVPQPLSLTLDGGATYSTDGSVDVVVGAADATSGIASVLLSSEPGFSAPTSVTWSGTGSETVTGWALTPGEGSRTVYLRVIDVAGNIANSVAGIEVDTGAPAGTAFIDADADGQEDAWALGTGVVVRIFAPADTRDMALGNGSLDCNTATWTAFAAAPNWTLDGGSDGAKTVVVCLRDAAGNIASTSDGISLDRQDPTGGSLTIDKGASHATNPRVLLSLTAPADVASLALADGASLACATASYEAFSSTRAWTLPSGDGTKQVTACLRDAAGRTASVTDSIVLDTTLPAGTVVLDADGDAAADTHATSASVDVLLTHPSDTTGVAVANELLDCATASYAPPGGATTTTVAGHLLGAGDGAKTVVACFQDAAGNRATASASIILDTGAPAGSVVIAGGATTTRSDLVDLALDSPADTVAMKIFNGVVDCASATIDGPRITSVASWDLDPADDTANDGSVTVTACFLDGAGLRSGATDVILLDRVAPTGTVSIDGGAADTRSHTVTISLTASETVSVALVNGTSLNCTTASYGGWVATRSWTLAAGEGSRSVAVCFRDSAGNTGSATDAINVDTLPPTGTLAINGVDTHTDTNTVTLTVSASADASSIAIANESLDCSTASYGGISSPLAWTLGLGEGTRRVVACLKDGAGNVASLQDEIILDTLEPEPKLVIGDGSGFSTTSPVSVTVSFPNDVNGYAVAQTSLNCNSATYTPVLVGTSSATTNQALGGGDGAKTVVACVRDQAGNLGTLSGSVTLDTTNPTGSVAIDGGAAWATRRSVVLSFTAPSDVVSMAVADGTTLSCASATYEPYASVLPWTLPAGDGDKDVVVCFKDRAGRTASDTDRIGLDTSRPAGAFVIDSSSPVDGVEDDYATSTSVSLAFTAPGGEDLSTLQVAVANGSTLDCSSAAYSAYPLTHRLSRTLTGPDGLVTVSVCFRDAAGNTASAADSIVLDRSPPGGSLSIARDLAVTGSDLVDLIVSATGDTTQMKVFNGTVSCASQTIDQPYATSVASWDLDPADNTGNDGTKTVTVCLRDAAGLRATATDTIVLDRIAPTVSSVVIDGGAAMTRNTLVAVTVSASDGSGSGITGLRLSEASDFSGAPWLVHSGATTLTENLVLSSAGGTKTVYAQVRDAAGNVSVLDGSDSDTLGLDNIAPTITGISFPNAPLDAVISTSVQVVVDAYDDQPDASGYRFKILEGPIDCNTLDYSAWDGRVDAICGLSGCTSATYSRSLSAGEGAKPIEVCLADPAGNITAFPFRRSVILDLTAPGVPTGLVAVSGSEQLSLSWFAAQDAQSGIAYYEILVREAVMSPPPAQYFQTSQPESVVTGLRNGTPYSISVRSVDRAGRTSTWSTSIEATPGYRQHLLSAPLAAGDRIDATLTNAQGRLWWPANEVDPSTGLEHIVVASCDLVLDDCSDAGDWQHFRLDTGYRNRARRIELVGTPDELIIPTVENPADDGSPRVGFWHCSRQSDCTLASSWIFVELIPFGGTGYSSGTFRNTSIRADVAPDRTIIASVGPGIYRSLAISTCHHGSDCSQAASWSTVAVPSPINTQAVNQGDQIAVVATDTQIVGAFSANAGICHVGCQLSTGCDLLADWTGPSCDDFGKEELFLAKSNRYLHELGEYIDNPSVRRCPLNADCAVAANWSTHEAWISGDLSSVELEVLAGKVNVIGVDDGSGEIRLSICESGDTTGCVVNADWSVAALSLASGGPRVGLTARGADVIAGWRDEDRRMRLILPTALSPEGFRVAAGAGSSTGELNLRWDASPPDVAGHYILLDDPWALSPGWDSEILIGDPSVTSNIAVPLLSGTTYRASVKSFLADGQRSSAPRSSLVRSARRVILTSSGSNSRTADAHDGRLAVALAQGTLDQPYVWWCDRHQSDCEVSGDWTLTSPLVATAPYQTVAVGVDEGALYVAARSDAGDLHLSRCDFSTGCDADAYWSPAVTLGTGLDSYPMVSLEARGSRVWVTHRDGAGAMVVSQCLKSTGCAAAGNWTTLTVDATPNTRFGATLRAVETGSTWEVVILRSMDDSVRFFHCDGTSTGCDAPADFDQSTLVTTGVFPDLPHPTLATSPEDPAEGASFATAWDDVLYLGVCATPLSRCGDPQSWVLRDVSAFSTYNDTNVEVIHGYGGERYLAYQEGRFGGKISLWSCADECYMPDQWRRAGAIVSGTAATTNRTTGRWVAFDERDGSVFFVNNNFSSTRAHVGARTDIELLPRQPYLEGGHPLPGRLQAEAYDHGDLGIAYFDRSRGNSGGEVRVDDVDVRACAAPGCYQVTDTQAREWLEYRVSVGTAGTFTPALSVASPVGGNLRLEVDGADAAGVLVAPNTGDFDTFQTVTGPDIPLSAGDHVVRLYFEDGDIDVDWIDLL